MKKHIRTLCALLSAVMLLPVFSTLTAAAETAPPIPEITPAPIEQTENAAETATPSEPELLNVSSGSVVVDVGKTYRPVLDGFELASINSFSACVQPQAGNLLYANAIGTAQIMLLYYNENNILSVFNCQIEVMDVLGTIDVTRSNVFVEKGQKYILDFGDLDVYSVNIMNYNTLILRPLANYKAIEAVEADTVNIYYSYYDENKTSISAVCTVEVFENANIAPGEYVINNNGCGLYITNNSADGIVEGTEPASLTANAVRWVLNKYSDGYYTFRSKNLIQYLAINPNGNILNSTVTTNYNVSALESRWKILKDHDGRFIILPQYAETENLVLWLSGKNPGSSLILVHYYNTAFVRSRGWDIYDDTKYFLDNYYDISFADTPLINYIPLANNFVINVFAKYSTPIIASETSTYASDHPLNICKCPNINCNDLDNCTKHHIIASEYHNYNKNIYHSKNHFVVMWANRTAVAYCDNENGVHTVNAPGLAYGKGSAISFFYWPGSYHESAMSILLTHEFAHAMGCPEVYLNPSHDGVDGMTCVMEYFDADSAKSFYEYITESPDRYLCAFCISCQNTFPLWIPYYPLT